MKCFILYQQDKEVKAAILSVGSDVPKAFFFEGQKFKISDAYLGDFNHLLTENRELLGFEFLCAGLFKKILSSSLIKQSSNVKVDSTGAVQFILCANKGFHSDNVQAIGNWIYYDGQTDCIVLIPEITEWGNLWSKIGFEINTNNIPIPVDSQIS